jgi:hypothetical protein
MRHYRRSQRVGEKLVKGELKIERKREGADVAETSDRMVNRRTNFSNAD